MARKVVIDTCSLINLFRYYYFDKYNGAQLHKSLLDFIISKIMSDEIIIIDKVDDELMPSRDNTDFKKAIHSKVVNTDSLLNDVRALSNKYYIAENEKFLQNNQNQIESEMSNFESVYADLFLIAYCLDAKNNGDEVVLITDETTNLKEHRKLVQKVPTICKSETIEYRNMSYLLFEIYKNELKFSLQIAPSPAQAVRP